MQRGRSHSEINCSDGRVYASMLGILFVWLTAVHAVNIYSNGLAEDIASTCAMLVELRRPHAFHLMELPQELGFLACM